MAGGRFLDLLGTSYTKLQIGLNSTGLALKVASAKLRARNTADSADAPLIGSVIGASGDQIQLNEDAAGSGADWLMTINRPASGMTAAVNLTLPPTVGSTGQALTTDGSTGALSWTSIATGNDKVITDTTSIAFGTGSPLTMFTLPANAIVQRVRVIVDTAFNGTPSLSVGISGTTSKYMSATAVDLSVATTWEANPGLASVGTTEAIIATYAAGGATVGAGRIELDYCNPS
jgi:hypothetical protein